MESHNWAHRPPASSFCHREVAASLVSLKHCGIDVAGVEIHLVGCVQSDELDVLDPVSVHVHVETDFCLGARRTCLPLDPTCHHNAGSGDASHSKFSSTFGTARTPTLQQLEDVRRDEVWSNDGDPLSDVQQELGGNADSARR